MKNFIKNLVRHPGTWTFLALLMVIIAAALPFAAVPLLVTAAALMGVAALVSIYFFFTDLANRTFASFNHLYEESEYNTKNISGSKKISKFLLEAFWLFADEHPIQLAIILIGAALVITALVLTIGFLTGGFGFMAPVFAWLSVPFIAATGSQLSAAALVFATLMLAAINLPNTLKRFAAWVDSFKYDFLAWAKDFEHPIKWIPKKESDTFWNRINNLMWLARKNYENPNEVDCKELKEYMPAVPRAQLKELISGVRGFETDCRNDKEKREWWTSHENLRDHALFQCYSYRQVISGGMNACIQNLFSSPYAEKCEEKTTNTYRI